MTTPPETFGYEYVVKIAVRISHVWATYLKTLAAAHYDYKCREAGNCGVINGLYNVSDPEYPSTLALRFDDADLITKVLEQSHYHDAVPIHEAVAMREFFRGVMDKIRARHETLIALDGINFCGPAAP
jgi:hypothetical protein